MGDSNFVKISNGGLKVESGKGGVSRYSEEAGTVVPLRHGVRESEVSRMISDNQGGFKTDNTRVTSVKSATRTNLPDEWGTVQDRHGNPLGNLSKLTDDCSIEIQGKRVRIDVAERMGLFSRLPNGELYITQPSDLQEQQAPLSHTESLKTNSHQETLNELNRRCPSSTTDAFMNQVVASIVDGTPANILISDYATAVGATDESIHAFAEDYINSLFEAGIDYAVRQSRGTLTSDQITEHIEKCSNQYKKTLLLSLHHNHLASAHELIQIVKQKKIV